MYVNQLLLIAGLYSTQCTAVQTIVYSALLAGNSGVVQTAVYSVVRLRAVQGLVWLGLPRPGLPELLIIELYLAKLGTR